MFSLSVGLTAQNYQTVVSTNTTTFIGNQVESIRIDSSFVVMGDSIFYPFYNIQHVGYDCFLPFSYSWIGKKIIIKENGYNYFINKDNDTVKINTLAQLNENWVAYETSNIIIMAEVIKHDTLSFLGQTDSAKTISFTAYNQSMDSISHPVNTMTIIISENFGLLKTVNFSQFAENTSPYSILQMYNLLGMSSPPIGLVNLTWREIYDFEIGDEIHIVKGSSYISSSINYITEGYEMYIYLDKTTFPDSVIYKVVRTLQTVNRENSTITKNEYIHDTVISVCKSNPYSNLDKLSGEVIGDYNLTEVRIEFGDVPMKTFPSYIDIHRNGQNEEDSCWIEVIKDGCFPSKYYLQGLGGPYHNCDYFMNRGYRELKYYKKGDKTWGTPLSIDNIKRDNTNLVKVYPNPASDNIHIEIGNEEWVGGTIQIMNFMGQVVFTNTLTSNKETISIEHLSSGLYIIQYNVNNQIFHFKFIKI